VGGVGGRCLDWTTNGSSSSSVMTRPGLGVAPKRWSHSIAPWQTMLRCATMSPSCSFTERPVYDPSSGVGVCEAEECIWNVLREQKLVPQTAMLVSTASRSGCFTSQSPV